MNFTEHYFDPREKQQQLVEGIFGDLVKLGATKMYKAIKEKPKKINDIGKFVDEGSVMDVIRSQYEYMLNLVAADLLAWKRISKDGGMVKNWIERKKNKYITQLVRGIIPQGDPMDAYGEAFDLEDNFLPNETSIYKTSNGGFITLISVSSPYDGPPLKPKQVAKLGAKLKNIKFFISVDAKADKWFVDKTGMHYKQFIVARRKPSTKQMKDDLEQLAATYEAPKEEPKVDAKAEEPKEEPKVDAKAEEPKEEPKVDTKAEEPKEEPKVDAKAEEPKEDSSKETWYKTNITKKEHDAFFSTSGSLKTILSDVSEYKSKEPVPKSEKIKSGTKFKLNNGGIVSLVVSNDGRYMMTMNDLGKDSLVHWKIVDSNDIKEI